jgi:hypothetical protein
MVFRAQGNTNSKSVWHNNNDVNVEHNVINEAEGLRRLAAIDARLEENINRANRIDIEQHNATLILNFDWIADKLFQDNYFAFLLATLAGFIYATRNVQIAVWLDISVFLPAAVFLFYSLIFSLTSHGFEPNIYMTTQSRSGLILLSIILILVLLCNIMLEIGVGVILVIAVNSSLFYIGCLCKMRSAQIEKWSENAMHMRLAQLRE